VASYLETALHDGSPWVLLACFVVFAGVVVGFYGRGAMDINPHPHPCEKPGDGTDLGTDMPAEATGREELEAILWPRRRGGRRPSRPMGRQE
jgi:hypothetical protein